MPRIFEPVLFDQGRAPRPALGTGTGVYGIVTNHGGGVAVSSQVDVGTAVRIYLPASRKIVRDTPAADKRRLDRDANHPVCGRRGYYY